MRPVPLPLRRPTGGPPVHARSGSTLIEVALVMVVLTLAAGMLSGIVVSSVRQRRINVESARAADTARAVMESLRAEPLGQAFALYNADDADDPRPDAPGDRFRVRGLTGPDGDLVGRVVFPTVGDELREDVEDPVLGMPRDLNGDRQIDALDHRLDYQYLPVRVLVEWESRTGLRRFEMHSTLVEFAF